MPHLRFRAIDVARLADLSSKLIDSLHVAMSCPAADFTIELVSSQYVGPNKPYPFVDVVWFDRGQSVQDESAEIITRIVREELAAAGNPDVAVAVVFHAIPRNNYYDNGTHY